jgi:predicted Zn-dependent protease
MKAGTHTSLFRSTVPTALIFTTLPVVRECGPKKGRVTANPTSGNSYSLEQEVEYGQKAIPEIERELPLVPEDHPVSKYINALGNRLAAKTPVIDFLTHFGS